jgi:hypothetical protein
VIADNKLALNAGWGEQLLAIELKGLGELGFDLGLTGFGELEFSALFAEKTDGLTNPDEAPENPVSMSGDLWLLGKHRMLCGDSTVANDVERVLSGVEPHLMVTVPDPTGSCEAIIVSRPRRWSRRAPLRRHR